jgi:hypothetical protein
MGKNQKEHNPLENAIADPGHRSAVAHFSDCWFESLAKVVPCQVQVSAWGRSLVQGSPTDCVCVCACLCVTECGQLQQ